jgi:hypothetical protein
LRRFAELWTHRFGWELQLIIDGEFQRSQVCRTQDEVLDTGRPMEGRVVRKGLGVRVLRERCVSCCEALDRGSGAATPSRLAPASSWTSRKVTACRLAINVLPATCPSEKRRPSSRAGARRYCKTSDQNARTAENGHQRHCTRPTMYFFGTNPQWRLSELLFR